MRFASLLASVDRSVLDVLGETVTYTPGEGDAVEVTGIFDAVYTRVDAGQAGVSTSGPSVWLLLADLPTGAADDEDATVTVAAVEYAIKESEPDGKGGLRLLLKKLS